MCFINTRFVQWIWTVKHYNTLETNWLWKAIIIIVKVQDSKQAKAASSQRHSWIMELKTQVFQLLYLNMENHLQAGLLWGVTIVFLFPIISATANLSKNKWTPTLSSIISRN